MKVDGNSNILEQVLKNAPGAIAKKAVDPLNLFGGDTMSKSVGQSMFPGAGGNIEEILASLSKKDKNNQFDTNGVSDGLFSGGKNFGDSIKGLASGAVEGAMGGISNMLGSVMGIVKQLLPMVMGFLGGL